ncbi:hypothetical protein [Halorussus litoreus]|nr:hypothetical protein [Halorussus litoreus]
MAFEAERGEEPEDGRSGRDQHRNRDDYADGGVDGDEDQLPGVGDRPVE